MPLSYPPAHIPAIIHPMFSALVTHQNPAAVWPQRHTHEAGNLREGRVGIVQIVLQRCKEYLA